MRRRRNSEYVEPGIEGVGWAGIPYYVMGMLVGIYLLARKSPTVPPQVAQSTPYCIPPMVYDWGHQQCMSPSAITNIQYQVAQL
jgi:hypothetical protein